MRKRSCATWQRGHLIGNHAQRAVYQGIHPLLPAGTEAHKGNIPLIIDCFPKREVSEIASAARNRCCRICDNSNFASKVSDIQALITVRVDSAKNHVPCRYRSSAVI